MEYDQDDLLWMIGDLTVRERLQQNANARLLEESQTLKGRIAELEEGGNEARVPEHE